jgi:hypothetical protein
LKSELDSVGCRSASGFLHYVVSRPSADKALASKLGDSLNLGGFGVLVVGEHGNLESGTVCSVLCGLITRHWLHDVVDMHRHTAGMRPKTVVNLVGSNQVASDGRRSLKQLSQLSGFGLSEIGNGGHVTLRFDYQGPKAQRADAMFDQPVGGPIDQSAG